MGSNIIELAKLGHDRAAELKASCGAVDVRSVAQLISDLATQLEVQLVRGNEQAVQLANAESKCRALAVENGHARERHVCIRALAISILEHSGGRMDWRGAMEDATELLQTVDSVYAKTPATDAFLAEVRAHGVDMLSEKFGGGTLLSDMVKETAKEFAAQLRKGAAL
ncbi:hypothetical protein OLN68_09615 [Citrobacter freundii]|nr:hypothetical protein [Citrobacter freundii]MCW1445910.1 hypothetical protein [Citrobacter freundii]